MKAETPGRAASKVRLCNHPHAVRWRSRSVCTFSHVNLKARWGARTKNMVVRKNKRIPLKLVGILALYGVELMPISRYCLSDHNNQVYNNVDVDNNNIYIIFYNNIINNKEEEEED